MSESRCRYVSPNASLAYAVARSKVRARPVSAARQPVSVSEQDLRDLMDGQVTCAVPGDAEWVPGLRDVRATPVYGGSTFRRAGDASWYSRPSKGERPRVRRAVSVESEASAEALTAALVELRAKMKGRKGKSRILLRAKVERLETALHILKGEPFKRLPIPTGCLPAEPADTLAHGRAAGTLCVDCGKVRRPVGSAGDRFACDCDAVGRYALYVSVEGEPHLFDRETGEYVTWTFGGMAVGGDFREPSSADRIRAAWPEGTGEYR